MYCEVEPKRLALAAANADLAAAVDKLTSIQNKIKALEEVLAKLTADFERATAEKLKCQEQADATNRTIKYEDFLSCKKPSFIIIRKVLMMY